MFQMAAYNVGDNLKEPVTAAHIGHILKRSLEEVIYTVLHIPHSKGKISIKQNDEFSLNTLQIRCKMLYIVEI